VVPNNGNGGQTFDVTVNSGAVSVDILATIEQFVQEGGSVSLSGAGSALQFNAASQLAPNAMGAMSVESGAKLSAENSFDIAAVGASPNGTLTVRGPGSTADIQSMLLARAGASRATVAVEDSGRLTVSGFAEIARVGLATVSVASGGVLETNGAYLGAGASTSGIFITDQGVGTATVSGPGSRWEDQDLIVLGDGGVGTVNISNGGLVVGSAMIVGSDDIIGIFRVRGRGTVTVDGISAPVLSWRH
jgi:T5SS/PEP-CTERM-associated repeat protein